MARRLIDAKVVAFLDAVLLPELTDLIAEYCTGNARKLKRLYDEIIAKIDEGRVVYTFGADGARPRI